MREAAAWSVVWVALALLFGGGVYAFMGRDAGLEYFAGYLIEKALSVDNIFVFVLIFGFFRVPARYQHRVLFWGILGALADARRDDRRRRLPDRAVPLDHLRVRRLPGVHRDPDGDARRARHRARSEPGRSASSVGCCRSPPTTRGRSSSCAEDDGTERRLAATPLFVVLALVETTDLIFAVDSIPAIFAVTQDPFIVYSSNVFAILGLRALYFLLADVIHRFHYLPARRAGPVAGCEFDPPLRTRAACCG